MPRLKNVIHNVSVTGNILNIWYIQRTHTCIERISFDCFTMYEGARCKHYRCILLHSDKWNTVVFLLLAFICHNGGQSHTKTYSFFSFALRPLSLSLSVWVHVRTKQWIVLYIFMWVSIEFSISLTWENAECRDNGTKKWEGERESAWLERKRARGQGRQNKNEWTGEHNAIYNVPKKEERFWGCKHTHMASNARSFSIHIFLLHCLVKVRQSYLVYMKFSTCFVCPCAQQTLQA